MPLDIIIPWISMFNDALLTMSGKWNQPESQQQEKQKWRWVHLQMELYSALNINKGKEMNKIGNVVLVRQLTLIKTIVKGLSQG